VGNPPETLYRPVFVGYTQAAEKIVVYMDRNDQLHIRRPDGELWALSHGSQYTVFRDPTTDIFRLSIESPEWTGIAVGTKKDLIEEEGIKAP
jgi:hypothetical protein